MNKIELIKVQDIVREAICRIDPYSLMEGGSPEDEFDSEINSITSQLQRCNSGNDVACTLSSVLNSAFSEKYTPELFKEEGDLIYGALVENGLK